MTGRFSSRGLVFVVAGIAMAVYGQASDSFGSSVFTTIGIIWALVGVAILVFYRGMGARAQKDAQLFATGARAPATVTAVQPTGMVVNNVNQQVRLALSIQPPGEAAFTHEQTLLVPFSAIPRVGDTIQVAFDPADRSRVALATDWNMDTGGGRALLADRPAPAAPAAPAAGAPDALDQLAKLAKLRDAGTITAAEFESQKAKLLQRS